MRPIETFYQVFPLKGQPLIGLAGAAMRALDTSARLAAHATDQRPVLFASDEALFASVGALTLMRAGSVAFLSAATGTQLDSLPEGLRMLVGDGADASAYNPTGR